jgi:Leucine-rich repeat (LRR) protein
MTTLQNSSTICSTLVPLAQSWRESVALLESAKNTYQTEATDEAWDAFQEALQACEEAQAAFVERGNEKIRHSGLSTKMSHALILHFFSEQYPEKHEFFLTDFGGNIESLYLAGSPVERLPNMFPKSLEELELDDTPLSNLPNLLPHRLRVLSLTKTNIHRLPDVLPNSLEELYLSGTQINDIPKVLPPNIKKIELRRTPFAKRADAQAIVEELEEKYSGLEITI